MNKYLFMWQLPVFGLLIVGWLGAGSYLLRVSIAKNTKQRRVPFGRCLLATLLSGGGGAFGGAVFFMLVRSIGAHFEVKLLWLAAPLAIIVMLLTAFIVLYSMYQLSAKDTLRVSFRPLIGVLIVVAIILTPTAIVTRSQGLAGYYQTNAVNKLKSLSESIAEYRRKVYSPPETLEKLIDKGYISPESITHQMSDKANGFLYLPYNNGLDEDIAKTRIVICSIGHKPSKGRAVMFANGLCIWEKAYESQDLLAEHYTRLT